MRKSNAERSEPGEKRFIVRRAGRIKTDSDCVSFVEFILLLQSAKSEFTQPLALHKTAIYVRGCIITLHGSLLMIIIYILKYIY